MAWYIPIYKGNNGELCCANGSDEAHHSNYVRRDKVREFIQAIVKRRFWGMEPVSVYSVTDSQFWDIETWNPAKVMAAGKCVWKEGRIVGI